MGSFDFGYGDMDGDDEASDDRLSDLVRAYESDASGFFDSHALEAVATHYYELDRFEDALGAVDRLIAQHPHAADGWMRRGILLGHLDRNAEALGAYDQALDLNPYDVETHVNRGIALDQLGRTDDVSSTSCSAGCSCPRRRWRCRCS